MGGIPKRLVRSARDRRGRAPWRGSGTITVPLVQPTLLYLLVIDFVIHFQVFEQIYLHDQRRPGFPPATETVALADLRRPDRAPPGAGGGGLRAPVRLHRRFALVQFRVLSVRRGVLRLRRRLPTLAAGSWSVAVALSACSRSTGCSRRASSRRRSGQRPADVRPESPSLDNFLRLFTTLPMAPVVLQQRVRGARPDRGHAVLREQWPGTRSRSSASGGATCCSG